MSYQSPVRPQQSLDVENAKQPQQMIYDRSKLLILLDFLIRPHEYMRNKLSAVRYVIAGCAFYGGMLFTIGACAGSSPAVADVYSGKGFDAAYPWLVTVTYFVGTYFFTVGCILLIVEAANMRYEEDLEAWQDGRRTAKPKFRLLCFEPTSLGWWGGVSYTIGALLYNIGSTTALANAFTSVMWSPHKVKVLTLFTFLVGGPFFLTAGLLYVIQYSGNPLRGIFIPTKKADATSWSWWVNFFNWWGGVGFAMSGFWEYFYGHIPLLEFRVQNIIGFGLGGVMFTAGGYLLYAQAAFAKCTVVNPVVGKEEVSTDGSDTPVLRTAYLPASAKLGWAGSRSVRDTSSSPAL